MHLRRDAILCLLLLAAPGCATLGVGGGEPPEPLAYGQPVPDTLAYAFQDSSVFTFDAGAMGATEMLTAWAGLAELVFRQDTTEILRATLGFTRLDATFASPGQGAVSADQGDLTGRFSVRLDPRGRMELAASPSIAARLGDMARLEPLARLFFARLPDRVVVPGESWTDTINAVEQTAGIRTDSWQVVTSTLVGDTAVGEQRLLRIRTETLNQVEVTGSTGGVEILQRFSGDTRGEVLWDPEARVLYAREEEGELRGTLEIPGVSQESLPVQGRVSRSVVLQPSP